MPDKVIQSLKDRIFMLEMETIELRKDQDSKWKKDKLDIAKAHLEIAGRTCLHILYPELEPDYVKELSNVPHL